MSRFDAPGFIEPAAIENETLETRRKRLKFRSWHRGIKEADLILGHFADEHLDALSVEQLDRYEILLREPDADLVAWITGDRPAPEEHQSDVMTLLQSLDYLKIVR